MKSSQKKTWLITGGAGFIGSHIISALLEQQQKVVVLDNFVTGNEANLKDAMKNIPEENIIDLKIYKSDIRDYTSCWEAMQEVDIVLHHAALASVPESIKDPVTYHQVNVQGFWNILESARNAGVKRLVYASSSAVYGDSPTLPKIEQIIANPLSPYAGTKQINEIQAQIYQNVYGLETIGLRYFNVYGSRQHTSGAYASVIPKWIDSILNNSPPVIYGDGENTRDFCHVSDVVLANLLAATTTNQLAIGQIYNIGSGTNISLKILLKLIQKKCSNYLGKSININPIYYEARKGDIRDSVSDITKAKKLLEYSPKVSLEEGLYEAINYYVLAKNTNQK